MAAFLVWRDCVPAWPVRTEIPPHRHPAVYPRDPRLWSRKMDTANKSKVMTIKSLISIKTISMQAIPLKRRSSSKMSDTSDDKKNFVIFFINNLY